MPNENIKKKKNRYEDVPINIISVNNGEDSSIVLRRVYEIILNSKGESDSSKRSN